MNEKNYLLISAVIFALAALWHLTRLVGHWSVQVGATTIPLWWSWLGLLILGVMSVWAFRLIMQWRSNHHRSIHQ